MRIYGFYNEYSGQEIDTALRELTASEYRQLGNIFEDKGINLAKYHKDRENFSSSIILKFTNILEQNRRNGLTSFNQLTTNIINLINLGFLSPDAFDFKSLMGITEKENNLVGKSQSSVSSNYINYLTQFFNNKFGYKGKISLDRESLISAITYHKTESELEKRQTESKLTISYEEYENLDVKGQHKLNNKITKNGPKRILKRIFRRK